MNRPSRKRTRCAQHPDRPKRRRTSANSSIASSNKTVGPSKSPASTTALAPAATPIDDEPLDPKSFFFFMKLPAELRLHIYHMAFERDGPLLLHIPRTINTNIDSSPSPSPSEVNLSISPRLHNGGQAGSYVEPRRQGIDTEETKLVVQNTKDSINPALLRTCKQIYRESLQILYSANSFTLLLSSGIHTLSSLHQRTRSLIKSIHLTIPSHHDILDGFADLIRLGLRYCWGLKSLIIVLPGNFPFEDRGLTGATNIYANAFHILRWLPKGCKVKVEGDVGESVRRVVEDEGRLMMDLDEVRLGSR